MNNRRRPNPQNNNPTLLEVLYRDLSRFSNWLFATTEMGGLRRRWLFILISAWVWAYAGANNTPLIFNDNPLGWVGSLIIYPFEALFAYQVIRHVIVIAIGFWLAIQLAAHYLDDIFELEDPTLAEKYILQASLADRYEIVEIKDGKVLEKHKNSPVVRVGGPGFVKVHFDSAALFEKFNGEPVVIAPEDNKVALDRFERLRKVISLVDHLDQADITARTKDGIKITAGAVQLKFHIFRGNQPPSLKKPFPLHRESVETLVYGEGKAMPIPTKTEVAKLAESIPENQEAEVKNQEVLRLKSTPFQTRLKRFIASSTLSEFLARVSEQEIQQGIEETGAVEVEARQLVGEEVEPEPEVPDLLKLVDGEDEEANKDTLYMNIEEGPFYQREEITSMIYQGNDEKEKLRTGLELDWIDIGTWELPKNATQIAKKHQDAWAQSLENLANKSPQTLKILEMKSKNETFKSLLNDIVLFFHLQKDKLGSDEIVGRLLNFYYQKITRTMDLYREHKDSPPIPLRETLKHLDETLKEKRWLN
jgi:hypothetical protein